MGEVRKTYSELAGDLDQLETSYLQDALEEITSGTTCFGYMDEWTNWFHYLAPRLVQRSSDSYVYYLYEHLVSAFMALYPDETRIDERDNALAKDIFCGLALAPMDPSRWHNGAPCFEKTMYSYQYAKTGHNPWTEVSGDIAAGASLCYKYLSCDELGPWIDSALAINEVHFRTQLLLWCVEAEPLLSGKIRRISKLPEDSGPSWAWSHALSGKVPEASGGDRGWDYVDSTKLDEKRSVVCKVLRQIDLDKHWLEVESYSYLLEPAEKVLDSIPLLYD